MILGPTIAKYLILLSFLIVIITSIKFSIYLFWYDIEFKISILGLDISLSQYMITASGCWLITSLHNLFINDIILLPSIPDEIILKFNFGYFKIILLIMINIKIYCWSAYQRISK